MGVTLRAPMALDEYLDQHFEPECEFIAGELRPKPMGTNEHSDLQLEIATRLREVFGRRRTRIELRVRHGSTVLIPDVCVYASEQPALFRHVLDEAPLLCVEILSPSQRAAELFLKCRIYHEWGVPFCWIIDPVEKRAWQYQNGWPEPQEVFTELAGPTSLPLTGLF